MPLGYEPYCVYLICRLPYGSVIDSLGAVILVRGFCSSSFVDFRRRFELFFAFFAVAMISSRQFNCQPAECMIDAKTSFGLQD
jgi:hypothetical protein